MYTFNSDLIEVGKPIYVWDKRVVHAKDSGVCDSSIYFLYYALVKEIKSDTIKVVYLVTPEEGSVYTSSVDISAKDVANGDVLIHLCSASPCSIGDKLVMPAFTFAAGDVVKVTHEDGNSYTALVGNLEKHYVEVLTVCNCRALGELLIARLGENHVHPNRIPLSDICNGKIIMEKVEGGV